ncbi:MAG: CPBP family intramembrane metalloprotease [Anaerolinea sp.]|nr:CPBP family intramembrane metalloprotease [Anaerolinea sp.]
MIIRVAVFYGLTWFFLILLGGVQQETGLLPTEIGLAQWATGIAALLMLLIFRRDGHKIAFFTPETSMRRYLLVVLIPIGLNLIVAGIGRFIPQEAAAPLALYDSLWLVILWAPLGALGEEIGWRGYLHKKLDTRLRGLYSSILVGVLWFPIHVQFFAAGPFVVFFLALLIVSYSIVMYTLVQDTGFNVLLATVFHLAINLSNLLYLDRLYETWFMMVNALVWLAAATVLVLAKRELFLRVKEVSR